MWCLSTILSFLPFVVGSILLVTITRFLVHLIFDAIVEGTRNGAASAANNLMDPQVADPVPKNVPGGHHELTVTASRG